MRVILGVTGCIGAYKSATILRLLQKAGYEVLPIMTRHAQEFMAPLTLEKLSGHRVITQLFADSSSEIEHIALARKSDLLLVAPATANILGKFAHGIADDFLSTLYLSTTTSVIVAPAMNVEMWHHPATQENLKILRERGVVIVEPEAGYLACGEEGEGRLAEPEKIAEAVFDTFGSRKSLQGKRVLVTAGPTVEDIDPVRFISNRSTGRMGYAMAREAQLRGATVVLVSGPAQLQTPEGVHLVAVRSAREMAEAVFGRFAETDVIIMAAAVSDFAPAQAFLKKLKKEDAELVLRLEKTTDILEELGKRKTHQFLVGFSAESEALQENARQKMRRKDLDLAIANPIGRPDLGFGSEYNQVIILDPEGREEELPRLAKSEIARRLWDRIEERLALREKKLTTDRA